jgi:putative cardiolipin synthase
MLVLASCGVVPQRMDAPVVTASKPAIDSPLVKIVQASTPSPELTGFRLMPLAAYSLDARIELIRRAQYSLDIQYYLIANDRTGRLLLRNVRDAANRGVRVRVLVDDLYTSGADPMFIGLSAFPTLRCGSSIPSAAAARVYYQNTRRRCSTSGASTIACTTSSSSPTLRWSSPADATSRTNTSRAACRVTSSTWTHSSSARSSAQLENIFDAYWNSAHAYPVAQIVATSRSRAQLQNEFNVLVDEADQMMQVTVPPIDILGYGPITDDLEAGRLGLEWGKATAFADSPDKVTAMTPEEARSMSVTMNGLRPGDGGQKRGRAFVALLRPGHDGRAGIRRFASARGQGYGTHQFARIE